MHTFGDTVFRTPDLTMGTNEQVLDPGLTGAVYPARGRVLVTYRECGVLYKYSIGKIT